MFQYQQAGHGTKFDGILRVACDNHRQGAGQKILPPLLIRDGNFSGPRTSAFPGLRCDRRFWSGLRRNISYEYGLQR